MSRYCLNNHCTKFPSILFYVVIIKPFQLQHVQGGFFYSPLLPTSGQNCAPTNTGMTIVFCGHLFIFLSSLCRMKTS